MVNKGVVDKLIFSIKRYYITMKYFLLFIFMIFSVILPAQQPVSEILKEMKSHAYYEQQAAQNARAVTTASNASTNIDIKHYKCEWEIDPAVNYIKGKVTSTFLVLSATNTIIFDLSKILIVDSVVNQNIKVTFIQNANNTVVITLPNVVNTNTIASVSIYYKGAPNATGNGSFTNTTHGGVPVLWTLSEPYGARDWWPCKDVLNDKADSIDIIVTCPTAYKVSSNGMVVSDVVNAGKRTMHYNHKYPITTYLVAIACSNYVVTPYNFNIQGQNLLFENWTYPESAVNFGYEVYGIELALNWFTKHYGPYPFINERYAQTQFSWGGGMEHQTNSFVGFPGQLLAAHELAHQWFGDKTTCGSWKDIWVNEGLTSFSHWFYFETQYLPNYYNIRYDFHREVTSDSSGSVYVNDTTNIGRVFDWRLTYVKGAYIMHMLRGILGDDAFFKAMKDYGADAQTKYNYAKTEDVKRVFEQSTGKNLNEFFKDWIYGEGWPIYNVKWYNNNNGWLNIKVGQTQSHPSVSFFEMPLRVQFKNATQDTTLVLDVQQNGQVFGAKINFIPDTVLIDPDLWLLSKNNTTQKLATPSAKDVIQIYPNPSSGDNWNILIKNPSAKNYEVRLMNALGQTIYRKDMITNGADLFMPIPNHTLAMGIYNIVVSNSGNKLSSQQVVK
jgi:aminopeptidase N